MAENTAIELLNNAKLATNSSGKVLHLEQLREILLNKQPVLLDTLLPEVLLFQAEPASSVRKYVADFCAAAAQTRPSSAVLAAAAQGLAGLMYDGEVDVAKQALIAAHVVLKAGLAAHAAQSDAAMNQAWTAVRDMQTRACALAMGNPSACLRIGGIKLLEQAVLAFTADTAPTALPGALFGGGAAPIARLPDASELVQEADAQLRAAAEQLRLPGVRTLPGSVVVTLMQVVTAVALQRPSMLGKVLPALLALANQGGFKSPSTEDGQDSSQASIAFTLRHALQRLLRAGHDAAKPWRKRLESALRAMGADAVADSALRQLERAAKQEQKRKAGAEDAPSSNGTKRQRTTEGTPPPLTPPGSIGEPGIAPGPLTEEQVVHLQGVVAALLEHGREQAVQVILEQVSPEALAELVIRCFDFLPATRPAPEPGSEEETLQQQQQQPPAPILQAHMLLQGWQQPQQAQGLAGMQPLQSTVIDLRQQSLQQPQLQHQTVLDLRPQQQQQQQQEAVLDPRKQQPLGPSDAQQQQQQAREQPHEPPPPPPQPQQQQQQQRQQRPAAVPPAAATGPPRPTPLPVSLTPSQATSLRHSAIKRILTVRSSGPIRHYRELLLAKLAADAPPTGPLADLVLGQLIGSWHGGQGHSLAMRWLYALFVHHCMEVGGASAGSGPGADIQEDGAVGDSDQGAGNGTDAAAGIAGAAADGSADAAAEGPADMADATAAGGAEAMDADVADAVLADVSGSVSAGMAATMNADVAVKAGKGPAHAAVDSMDVDAVREGATQAADAATSGQEVRQAQQAQDARQQEEGSTELDAAARGTQAGVSTSTAATPSGSEAAAASPVAAAPGVAGVAGLLGSPYEALLLRVLDGLRDSLPGTDRAIMQVLLEAPALPAPSVTAFLRQLLSQGSEWATLALNATQQLIAGRPPLRARLLMLALDAAVDPNPGTRGNAVRLVANKLLPQPALAEPIVAYATQALLQLERPQQPQQQQQEQGQEQGAQSAEEKADADGAGHVTKQQQQQQQQQQQPPEGAGVIAAGHSEAANADGAVEATTANGTSEGPQTSTATAAAAAAALTGGEGTAAAPAVTAVAAAAAAAAQAAGTPGAAGTAEATEAAEMNQAEAERLCTLHMALCAKRPVLLGQLLGSYGRAGFSAQAAVEVYASNLAKALGPSEPALLGLIRRPPPGCQKLLLLMIGVLVETLPPKQLVQACVQHYTRTGDVELVAPVTVAMPRGDVIKLLPRLLELQPTQLRALFKRLTSPIARAPAAPPPDAAAATTAPGAAAAAGAPAPPPPKERPALFNAAELLLELHAIDPKRAGASLKKVMAAIDTALHSPETFPQSTVAQAISQLEAQTPLPQLFMRTVILTLQTSPRLLPFVMELMARLISKQVWTDPNQWQGFLLCAEKTAPSSYPVLLQLPSTVLETALEKLPRAHWVRLTKYATSDECQVPVFAPVREVLNRFLSRAAAEQAKAKADAEAAAAAAKEAEAAAAAEVAGVTAEAGEAAEAGVAAEGGPSPSCEAEALDSAAAAAENMEPAGMEVDLASSMEDVGALPSEMQQQQQPVAALAAPAMQDEDDADWTLEFDDDD